MKKLLLLALVSSLYVPVDLNNHNRAFGQDGDKGKKDATPAAEKYKVVSMYELLKLGLKEGEKAKAAEGSKKGGGGGLLIESDTLLPGLNALGNQNWEAVFAGKRGVLFQKSAKKWGYKAVTIPDSPLNGKSSSMETLILVLDGVGALGWSPCLGSLDSGPYQYGMDKHNIILKKNLPAED